MKTVSIIVFVTVAVAAVSAKKDSIKYFNHWDGHSTEQNAFFEYTKTGVRMTVDEGETLPYITFEDASGSKKFSFEQLEVGLASNERNCLMVELTYFDSTLSYDVAKTKSHAIIRVQFTFKGNKNHVNAQFDEFIKKINEFRVKKTHSDVNFNCFAWMKPLDLNKYEKFQTEEETSPKKISTKIVSYSAAPNMFISPDTLAALKSNH